MTAPLIAVLGGGQLGRMLALAGLPLGVRFRFLDPTAGAPAGATGELLVGAFDDADALAALTAGADVVTYEWEGVPAATAEIVGAAAPLRPGVASLSISQDRLVEKQCLVDHGITTAPFAPVDDLASLQRAADAIGAPAILKTRTGGYDGKGQAVLQTADDEALAAAWDAIGGRPAILEGFVPFTRELSIIAVRSIDGTVATYPLVENVHRDGILRVSTAPAPAVSSALQGLAQQYAVALCDALDHVGVLTLELFDTGDGTLVANEFAPRVHNSGHWTIEGAETSQFENHVRAVLGWPLGSTAPRGVSRMYNAIGTLPDRDAVLAVPGAHFHDYGKAPREGRKVGHVTLVAHDADTLNERDRQLP